MRASGWVALATLLAVVGAGAVKVMLLPQRLTEVEQGRRLAERQGCYGCHGAEATKGAPNLGAKDPVPSFHGGVLMMDAPRGAPQVQEWIEVGSRGVEAREALEIRRDSLERASRGLPPIAPEDTHPMLRMPAFGKRLSPAQVDRLVAFCLVQDGFGLEDVSPGVHEGMRVARRAGCFSCHGPMGQFCRPNPGSLKGYIPAWSGGDAAELVTSHEEFREWVREGQPKRLRNNPIAKVFLQRQAVHMPAYGDSIAGQELDVLDSLFTYARGRAWSERR